MNRTKYVAHRGLSMNAPENTLAAFDLAGKAKFWAIECDTYCTVDGRWIVHHDRTVNRMTNGSGKTKDFTFEAIRALNIVSGNEISSFPNQKIPTLEEVLALCAAYEMHAFIEIEEYHSDADLQALIKLVEDCDMIERCSFICFDIHTLKTVRKLHPIVNLGYLSSKRPSIKDIELVHDLGRAFLNYSYKVINTSHIHNCRNSGLEVSVWTVNSKKAALQLIAAGVNYITTDTTLFTGD